MNIALWIVQILLALHTLVGAFWKFTVGDEAMGTLVAIPRPLWLGLSAVEILCAIALISPAFAARFGKAAVIGAIVIAAEMLLFCGVHALSGGDNMGPMIYWLVVAVVCAFIVFGRLKLRPHS